MDLTWLDSNSWLIEIAGKRILLDPWLVGTLVFGKLDWLFKGEKRTPLAIPEKIDLILLSQGLEDHAHPPTLQQLDRAIPVVASPNAAKVVQALGYTQVTALQHGESFTLDNRVAIKALPGSPIGSQLVENGYLLKDLQQGYTLYYEPHGFHSPSIRDIAPVDVVIAPIVELSLLGLAPILKGQKSALQACQWLKPQVILPTAGAGDISYQGILARLIREAGSVNEFRTLLAQTNLATKAIAPKPGERVTLELTRVQQNLMG
jgi:L-ascorbate metabolism protein UlaG (beta-lactamase superfamily)